MPYNLIDDHPGLPAFPIDYANSRRIIVQLDNMESINAGLEVDFSSQVCAKNAGTWHISGTRGQLDFHEGAHKSKGDRLLSSCCQWKTQRGR